MLVVWPEHFLKVWIFQSKCGKNCEKGPKLCQKVKIHVIKYNLQYFYYGSNFQNFHNCGNSGHTNQSKYPIKRYWCVQDWQARLPVEDPHIRQFQQPLIKGCIEHIRWWFWYPFNIYFYIRILKCICMFLDPEQNR